MERENNINGKVYLTTRLGKELDIRRGISIGVLVYLVMEIVVLVTVLLLDFFKVFDIWCRLIGGYIEDVSIILYEHTRNIKCMLWKGQESILNVILTLGTILAAAVIFFYSVQDNKKGGIPNRTIISYTSGSFTVPVLFITIMFMIPLNQIAFFMGWRYFAWVEAVCTYITQMIIIFIILKSTSHFYSIHAICNAEIRQYQKLIKIEEKETRMVNLENTEERSSLIWTYLLQHMEQVLLSEELITDKLEIARRLLRVPYYEKEVWIWEEREWLLRKTGRKRQKRVHSNPQISRERLKSNHLNSLYEFYYRNLITVLQCINQQECREERSKIYLILYEFMEELTELYEAVIQSGEYDVMEWDKCDSYYVITFCGILNAIMDSNVKESADFCNYVFNNLVSKNVWRFQICLYIIFQEYLYRVNEEAIKLDALEGIQDFETWKYEDMTEQEKEMCWEFWGIWTKHTTLSKDGQKEYRKRAFTTLEEGRNESVPIMHIRNERERIRRKKI